MNLARYFLRKIGWYLVVFFVALLINFILPRLIPGNPVDALVAQMTRGGGASGDAVKAIYENYMREFGLDQPMWKQFLTYVGNVLQGDLGTSFAQYPASVNTLIAQALPWSIALQLPAIIVGWVVGNIVGAIAAFKGGWFDRGAFLALALPLLHPALLPGDHPAVRRRRAAGLLPGRRGLLVRSVAGVLAGLLR